MRYVLIDRLTSLNPPDAASAVKCVSLSEDVFAEHFPGLPVMPGALVLESMAQVAGVLLEATARQQGRADLYAVLGLVERAKFRHAVVPGDRIDLQARSLAVSNEGGRFRVEARVDSRLVADAELTMALRPLESARVIAQREELLRVWSARRSEDD